MCIYIYIYTYTYDLERINKAVYIARSRCKLRAVLKLDGSSSESYMPCHAASFQNFNLEKMRPAPGRFELSKGMLK